MFRNVDDMVLYLEGVQDDITDYLRENGMEISKPLKKNLYAINRHAEGVIVELDGRG